jgi:hypothetical protein
VTTAFATVLHDPDALLATPFEAAAAQLRAIFAGIAVSLTEATHPFVERVMVEALRAKVRRHPTGEEHIGLGRRSAVALALECAAGQILYADPDHMLHWLRDDPDELRSVLSAPPDVGFLIVGRSPKAFAAVPERLQQTEAPINRAYELATGRRADLLAAVRRLSSNAARDIVAHVKADSYGNDVEWPLLAERLGHKVGYFAADGLKYRTIEEFGAAADGLDHDPLQWLRRVEMAAEQARVMRQLLQGSD